MPPPPKGKPPTKGAKQIIVENIATVHFYRNMSVGAVLLYVAVSAVFFYDNLTAPWTVLLNIKALAIYGGCYQMLKYISKARYATNGELLDPGLDLNMEGGMAEHVKDIIILTSITHILSILSNYFWLLLTLLPLRAFWLIWTNFLGPWFFEAGPDTTEQDEKKKKKLERKMKRYQQ